MFVLVDLAPSPAHIELGDAGDCTSFKVLARGSTDHEALAEALAPIGRMDAGHAWIEAPAVRRLAAARGVSGDWDTDFAAMLAFADSRGWTDDAGRIRAHVEWESAQASAPGGST